MTTIIGLKLDNRVQTAIDLQKILTHFGCSIKTRLGLHTVSEDVCASSGLIILEVINDDEALNLKNELLEISGIELQTMIFS
jgi:hypothetical protein